MSIRPPAKRVGSLKGLWMFLALALTGLAVSFCTPLRDRLTVENMQALAQSMGWWGPLALLAAGAVLPLVFLPRWPVCFLGGLLYGVFWGALLANIASTLGAWLHFVTARVFLAESSRRLLQRTPIDPDRLDRDRAFTLIFLLRAFPLSNSAATNVLAGTLGMPRGRYLAATFLGMIPSTVMYASWGKLLKKPGPEFYLLAAALLAALVLGALFGRRWLAGLRREPEPPSDP